MSVKMNTFIVCLTALTMLDAGAALPDATDAGSFRVRARMVQDSCGVTAAAGAGQPVVLTGCPQVPVRVSLSDTLRENVLQDSGGGEFIRGARTFILLPAALTSQQALPLTLQITYY